MADAPKAPVFGIAGRLLLLGFFTMEAVRQLRSHDFEFSVFGGIIFGVHELGHLVFMPLGEMMTVLGGSLSQILLPLAAILLFAKQRQRFAVAVCGAWLAISLGQLAVYISDARAESLDLVSFSPEGGGHDWNYLLERWNLLRQDVAIARLTRRVGWLALGVSWVVALGAMRRLWRGTTEGEAA